jgi:uncharacterized Zn finger protein (UPF0148 family)
MRLIQREQWAEVLLDGKRTVKVQCPHCGTWAYLDHEIAPDGTVTPSACCPVEGCEFHEDIRLDGWRWA